MHYGTKKKIYMPNNIEHFILHSFVSTFVAFVSFLSGSVDDILRTIWYLYGKSGSQLKEMQFELDKIMPPYILLQNLSNILIKTCFILHRLEMVSCALYNASIGELFIYIENRIKIKLKSNTLTDSCNSDCKSEQ